MYVKIKKKNLVNENSAFFQMPLESIRMENYPIKNLELLDINFKG